MKDSRRLIFRTGSCFQLMVKALGKGPTKQQLLCALSIRPFSFMIFVDDDVVVDDDMSVCVCVCCCPVRVSPCFPPPNSQSTVFVCFMLLWKTYINNSVDECMGLCEPDRTII